MVKTFFGKHECYVRSRTGLALNRLGHGHVNLPESIVVGLGLSRAGNVRSATSRARSNVNIDERGRPIGWPAGWLARPAGALACRAVSPAHDE